MPTPPTPTAGRRDRKRQQTAELLVNTAFELFATHGYEQVTMEQIAAAADVAKGTLYNHFPIKEALVQHRFQAELADAMSELLAEFASLPRCSDRLRAFMRATTRFSERYRDYMAPYLQYRLSQPMDAAHPASRSGLEQIYVRLLTQGQDEGEITSKLPAQQLANYLQFMHLCTVLRWLHVPGIALDAEFDAMLDLFLHGVCTGNNV